METYRLVRKRAMETYRLVKKHIDWSGKELWKHIDWSGKMSSTKNHDHPRQKNAQVLRKTILSGKRATY